MSRLADLSRPLRRRPGLTLVAALLLALGIGANSAIFSAVSAILLAPLPFADPERLVVLWKAQPALNAPLVEVSYPEFREWRRQSRSFAGLAAVGTSPLNLALTGRERPERLTGSLVSGELLALLGVRPAEGRLLAPEDDRPGSERMIVLSAALRRHLFGPAGAGGRPAVGQRLTLSGKSYTVAGVLPPRFDYPPKAEFWVPVAAVFPEAIDDRGVGFLRVVGRLRAGVPLQRVRQEMDPLVRQVARLFGAPGPEQKAVVVPLRELLLGDTRGGLWLLFGLVTLILLIACADVANLLLAEAAGRRSELAIRSSLGAGHGRLIRQLLAESAPAALLGGLGGLALTALGIRLLAAFGPAEVPRLAEVRLSPLVLGFTALLSLASLFLFATLPAVQTARRIDLREVLGETSRGSMPSRQSRRFMALLLAVETGMAVFLALAAGLLVSRFRDLERVELGFRPERVLTAEIQVPEDKAPPEAQAFWSALLTRLRSLPGATSAAAVLLRPLEGEVGWDLGYTVDGQSREEQAGNPKANFETVTPDYFQAMGIRLVAGRAFTDEDRADGLPVAIVSESLARRHWPRGDALGKRLKDFGPDRPAPWKTIVGVVGDVRYRGLATAPTLDSYSPYTQAPLVPLHVVLATDGDPLALAAALEREVWALDRNLPVAGITTMEARVASVLAQPRLLATLAGLFAVVAALLAAIGLYGVVSTSVERRTREIGLRTALGASRARVLRLVAWEGLAPAAAGAAVGLVAAFGLRQAAGWLSGPAAADPAVFTAFALLLLAAAGLAVYLPARRAMGLDPGLALREE